MDNQIIVVSVTEALTKRIKNYLSKNGFGYPVYESDLFDVLDVVRKEIQNGAKVIVSRGGTAKLIRDTFPVPVVEIHHDYFGVHNIVQDAVKISNKIAVVAFPLYGEIMKNYSSMVGIPLRIVVITDRSEIETAIVNLKNDGFDVVIGGLTVAKTAEKYGLHAIQGDADDLSVIQAIEEAQHTLKYVNAIDRQYQIVNGILNCATEGIIGVDGGGVIFNSNHNARKLLNCTTGENVKGIFPDADFSIIFNSNSSVANRIIEVGNSTLVVNSFPVFVNNESQGVVVTIQEEENIRDISYKIRQKHIQKGHVAKYTFEKIVGNSIVIKDTIARAKKFSRCESSILLLGETGTGKEVFAQSIHNYSHRKSHPFVAVNCAALPQNVLESELFGYVKGAFTGAKDAGRQGIFELAHGGTVFLDEIGEIPTEIQVKLLRVIQEREITRIGDDKVIPVDVRIIAATNKNLLSEIEEGRFREDLYYRINTLELFLPPLRERGEDIRELIEFFLKKHSRTEVELPEDTCEILKRNYWPGNVRQLENLVERISVLNDERVISSSIVLEMMGTSKNVISTPASPFSVKESDTNLLEKHETNLIREAIALTGGNKERAAAILGLSTTTLWRKVKKIKF